MVDLTFSYDFQIVLNGGMPIGVVHCFCSNMMSQRFKGISFEVRKKKLGRSMYNFKLV